MKYEGEYKEGKIWNGKGYDINGKLEFEVKDGNGKGKEYQICSGNIIFEGEYLNGIRNGKGKEYYNDYDDLILKFEGEYLNGKEWKGKRYYDDGKIESEGIFFENGNIKQYHRNGKLGFEKEIYNENEYKEKKYYENGKLGFESEILNGEYYEKNYNNYGKLEFESKTLKGISYVKTYYQNGKLEFEAKFLNKKSYGKKYCENGKLEYEGKVDIIKGVYYIGGKQCTDKCFDKNYLKEINICMII